WIAGLQRLQTPKCLEGALSGAVVLRRLGAGDDHLLAGVAQVQPEHPVIRDELFCFAEYRDGFLVLPISVKLVGLLDQTTAPQFAAAPRAHRAEKRKHQQKSVPSAGLHSCPNLQPARYLGAGCKGSLTSHLSCRGHSSKRGLRHQTESPQFLK